MKIERVHLNSFISVLIQLYNKGVDYVDIEKTKGKTPLSLSFTKDYMREDTEDEIFDKEKDEDFLDGEDLNNLI
jgi:hypothetical protein